MAMQADPPLLISTSIYVLNIVLSYSFGRNKNGIINSQLPEFIPENTIEILKVPEIKNLTHGLYSELNSAYNPLNRFSIWAKKKFFIEIRYQNFTVWTQGFHLANNQYMKFRTKMALNGPNRASCFSPTNTSRLMVYSTYSERGRSQLSIECLITHHGQKLRTRSASDCQSDLPSATSVFSYI